MIVVLSEDFLTTSRAPQRQRIPVQAQKREG